MIKNADKEALDTILVWKLDRFARDRYDEYYFVNLTLEMLGDDSILSAIADYLVVAQGEMASDSSIT